MPFLAITLLWFLNSKKELPKEGRNHWLSNLLLILCLVLFAVLAVNELRNFIEKRRTPQFRLKAAHVLWATAKCRHPGSATRAGGPVRRLRPNKVWSCVGYSEKLTQCAAAATGPKRREPMASGARQREKRGFLSSSNLPK